MMAIAEQRRKSNELKVQKKKDDEVQRAKIDNNNSDIFS